jgi:hypothetical protein
LSVLLAATHSACVAIVLHWRDAHVPDVTATMSVLFTTAVAPVNETLLTSTNMLDPVVLPAAGVITTFPLPACTASLNVSTMSAVIGTDEVP